MNLLVCLSVYPTMIMGHSVSYFSDFLEKLGRSEDEVDESILDKELDQVGNHFCENRP